MRLVDFFLPILTLSMFEVVEGEETNVAARSKGVEVVFGGTQLAISVLLGVYAGYRLDGRWGTGPWFLLVGGAVGLAVGMYSFLAPFFRKG